MGTRRRGQRQLRQIPTGPGQGTEGPDQGRQEARGSARERAETDRCKDSPLRATQEREIAAAKKVVRELVVSLLARLDAAREQMDSKRCEAIALDLQRQGLSDVLLTYRGRDLALLTEAGNWLRDKYNTSLTLLIGQRDVLGKKSDETLRGLGYHQ